ncbi:MAG TPA: POTRA domain-containing protein, partial [Myxococcaceae bacterium]
MRSPVLSHKSLLLLAVTLWALLPCQVLAQAETGAPATAPEPAAPAAAPAAPASDAPVDADAPADQGERVVEVRVEGNRRVEAEAVRRALRTKQGSIFDPTQTGEDLRAVWALGYFTDVQLLVQRQANGIAYVVRVEERPTVNTVKLSGNEELSQDDLKEQIDVKPATILDMDLVRSSAKKIQEKYVEKGYFLAEVTHEIAPVEGGQVDVVFVIDENSKVMVKDIVFLGAEKVSASQLKD